MKTDNFTKGVLTVIAICLVAIVFQNFNIIPTATANPTSAYTENVMDVNIKSISTHDLMGVNLKDIETYDILPVKIKGVDTYDELEVNITEIGGSSVSSSSGKLYVKCEN